MNILSSVNPYKIGYILCEICATFLLSIGSPYSVPWCMERPHFTSYYTYFAFYIFGCQPYGPVQVTNLVWSIDNNFFVVSKFYFIFNTIGNKGQQMQADCVNTFCFLTYLYWIRSFHKAIKFFNVILPTYSRPFMVMRRLVLRIQY